MTERDLRRRRRLIEKRKLLEKCQRHVETVKKNFYEWRKRVLQKRKLPRDTIESSLICTQEKSKWNLNQLEVELKNRKSRKSLEIPPKRSGETTHEKEKIFAILAIARF